MSSLCKSAFDGQRQSLVAINLSDNAALPVQLNRNFCNEADCEATIAEFFAALSEHGVECE